MVSPEDDPHLKDRVRRLMGYLRELVKARSKPVLDLRRHQDVVWLSGDAVEVAVRRDAGAGDVVLRSPRVTLSDPPALPARLQAVVRGDITNSAVEPTLDPGATVIDSAFDSWLDRWRAWAATDRERRPFWALHSALQRAMQSLVASPESVELVVASGLLSLPAAVAGDEVRTHLVTQPALVERDEATGDLLVRLESESAPRLEDTQLLTGMSVFDPSGARSLQEGAAQLASPIDSAIPVFLKAWAARSLTVPVEVEGEESATRSPDRSLMAAPALVLRTRGAFALVEYYDRIIGEAERDEVPVPLGLAQLVEAIETDDRVAWLDRTTSTASASLSEEPLFPLPANPEQREIIERLAKDSGVVVEGPPGTGKTHTIANLVSALLAQGQRVLVTSEKAQALRVLRDKLPPEMQELCVAITDVDRGGSTELNRSVAEIATRKSSFNAGAVNTRIDDLVARRNGALSDRTRTAERIRSLREAETFRHSEIAPGYSGTAAAIVRDVTAHADMFEWLPGPLHTAESVLSAAQFQVLLQLTARSTPDRARRLTQSLPDLGGVLPPPVQLQHLCVRATAERPRVHPESAWLTDLLIGAPETVLTGIRARCEGLQSAVFDLRHQPPAVQAAADAVLAGVAGHLWAKTAEIPGLVQLAVQCDRSVGSHVVDVPATGHSVLDAYEAMATAMQAGAEWRRGKFRRSDEQKAVEAIGALATVDGVPATTTDSIRVVALHLRALDSVRRAAAILSDLGLSVDVTGTRAFQVNALHNAQNALVQVGRLFEQLNSVTQALRSVHTAVPPVRSLAEAEALAGAAGAITSSIDIGAAQAELAQVAGVVEELFGAGSGAGAPPEAKILVDALRIGDHEAVVVALTELDTARAVQREEGLLQSLRRELDAAAPALAALVAADPADSCWDTRSDQVAQAWAWRRAHQWVLEQSSEGLDRQLESELQVIESDIAQLTGQLAAEKAWRACLERMTAMQVQALQAYRGHVSNVGKGKGKYAEQYRAAARSAMQQAQGAVPAWVMPLQQVLASIPPEPGTFDVVIVDEASQADIASLFLLWLAPRVIVVGDDKQCAPSEVTSGALDGVLQRLDTYLPDMPDYLRKSLTPRDSLFSMLRTRFGQVVRLREHFRCMPEIINWSSNQFYRDAPLVPLRQFGADRLDPLRTTYVDGGVVTGSAAKLTNRVEAVAIADQIERCLDDPAYDNKTFGVVVLQGQSQVDVITNELLTRLDSGQWEERRLRVGTPPDFQGDERHVIFLSLVIAPGQRVAARSDSKAQRAFNVAASRAQDQLWMFHSVTSDSLRSNDLRHSLLTYMESTSPAAAELMPEGVTRDERHPEFDSLFEQRVYLDITARGYHVNPQVEVNNRRIDLVVTGEAGKLAVECDGDAFHTTPEQRTRDLERERELKRCGWEFWRIRESAYYLDPVGSMQGLWRELDRRGISPTVLDGGGGSWTPAPVVDDPAYTDADDDGVLVGDEAPAAPSDAAVGEATRTETPDLGAPIQAGSGDVTRGDVEVPVSTPVAAADVVPTWPWEVVRIEDVPRPASVVTAEPLPMSSAAVIGDADSEIGTASETPDRTAVPRDGLALGARILAAAADAEFVTTTALAEEWGLDRGAVFTAIKNLIDEGALEQLGARRGARYVLARPSSDSVTGATPEHVPVTDTPSPEADTARISEHEDRPTIPPRLLSQLVLADAKRGPVTVAGLELSLHTNPEHVRAAVATLVEAGALVQEGEQFHLPHDVTGHPQPDEVRTRAVPDDTVVQAPQPAGTSTAGLPSAQRDSVKKLLFAASWGAPITLARAAQITRLGEHELELLLAELEQEQVLRRESGADGVVWARR